MGICFIEIMDFVLFWQSGIWQLNWQVVFLAQYIPIYPVVFAIQVK